jgi:hypothetical protein
MERLIRCRGCPRCGCRFYVKVARNWRWLTWNECADCHCDYAPPPSLKTAIPAILFGIIFIAGAVVLLPAAKNDSTAAIFVAAMALGGLTLTLGGVYAIVLCIRTPNGPLTQTRAFPILPSDPR